MTMKPQRESRNQNPLGRRQFLQCVTAATVAAAERFPGLTAGAPSAAAPSTKAIKALYDSLSAPQKKAVCFDWDHRVNIAYGRQPLHHPDPKGVLLRTHVSNAWLITPHRIGSGFYTDEQRGLILDVLGAVLTPAWVQKIKQQAQDDTGLPWGGNQSLAFFGKPESGRCQCVITGFHLTVR